MTYKEAYHELLNAMSKWLEEDRQARRKASKDHTLGQDYSLARCVNKAKAILERITE